MSDHLVMLGSGGWLPAHGRHTACALLRDRRRGILIDAGTGLVRLVERPELLDGIEQLDILLTHFHLDHIAGLAYLPALDVCEQTTVWGPGQLLYGTGTEELLARISREPFHPVPLADQDIVVRDLPGEEVELGGLRVAIRRQDRHSAPTLAFRFEDDLAWITDTAHDPDSARFAQGCRLLAHEAWFVAGQPRNPDIHSSAAQAASVATQAQAGHLLMIHLPPFQAGLEALAAEAEETFPAVTLARDGAEVSALLS